jgi:hypothetical protein
MKRFGFLLATCLLVSTARAAEVTRVATAGEDDTPFLMYLDLSFDRFQQNETIFRQWHQGGNLVELPELRYQNIISFAELDAHIGLFKDLELHFNLPYVIDDGETWHYSSATSAATSTITNNCIMADGNLTSPGCPGNGTAASLFKVPLSSTRKGFGNMTFGLAWAPFTQKKDDTKPNWLVGFDYTAPTATVLDPTVRTSSSNPGAVGTGVNQYKFFTALSRVYGPAEPYFKVSYSFPWQGPGYYSNCKNLTTTDSAAPGNCFTGPWTYSQTGIKLPQVAEVNFGVELSPYQDPKVGQRLTFDFRGIVNYIGPGRYYDELSYGMGKLLSADDYFSLGGQLGLIAQPSSFVALKLFSALLYNTEHSLTNEATGKDLSNQGSVNLNPGSPDINPNFDYRVDAPNRQLRAGDNFIFNLKATVSFIF